MISMIFAAALAAAQAAPAAPANPHAQHGQSGQMDQSKMDHSQKGDGSEGCCKKDADGKMKCTMQHKPAGDSAHQGHKGQ